MLKHLIATALMLTVLPLAAEAQQFFRYKDENGQIVINSSIPPEFVKNGYEILNEKGVVLREVAPQLSEEEIRRRRQEQERIANQEARDAELTKLYRSPIDVDRAMKTWLSRLDMEIRLKENRIAILRTEYNQLQSKAADQERAGKAVDEGLLADMAQIEEEIERYQSEIAEVEARQEEARDRFQRDRARMVILYERRTGKDWVEPENRDD
ncbi:hypothetical protein [Saccharospirillum salsuginis]|uniref:DUF4124 domain-containing protein n=1 Tax=Saccharospirillum salsuginis TaxID=418750 RepID=A0A918NBH5_9GAMM|nr:hypothetical protein [Saccharospirillum salsuginis]GGX58313.1 hypothetical protein GCM10007392_27670 [Saccharospirillum salsuginis]